MTRQTHQKSSRGVWDLVRRQHGVLTRRQLLDLGYDRWAIDRRIAGGRLHPVYRGVYAVGRPELTRLGSFIAAVLPCGPSAALSHESAAELWGIRHLPWSTIEVSVTADVRSRDGIVVHRRSTLTAADITHHRGIPVTTPACTIIDLASRLERDPLEAAINEADKLGLTDPDELRAATDRAPHRRGAPALRATLDRPTFTITDSELERLFLPIVVKAGVPKPETQAWVNGFRVDFYWPELGLVVETDGLTYHRTPAQQAEDRYRDQIHHAAGLTPLRFTRGQVKFDPEHVERILRASASARRPAPTGAGA